MAFTLPGKAEVQKALDSVNQVLNDIAPLEVFLPAQAKTGIQDAQKVLQVLEAAVAAL